MAVCFRFRRGRSFRTMDAAAAPEPAGLKDLSRQILNDDMFQLATNGGEDFKCLVMDGEGEPATRGLPSCGRRSRAAVCNPTDLASRAFRHQDRQRELHSGPASRPRCPCRMLPPRSQHRHTPPRRPISPRRG